MSALTVLLVSQPVGLVLALIVALIVGGDSTERARHAHRRRRRGDRRHGPGGLLQGNGPRLGDRGGDDRRPRRARARDRGPGAGGPAGAIQAVGALAGIAGVILVAREPDPEWRAAGRLSIGLAALAALGFGTFFLGLDLSSAPSPAWTIVAARTGGVLSLLVAAAFVRPSMHIERQLLPSLVAIGCFDVTANSLFAVATNHGLLSLVAVAGSLYSAVTVLLARFVLGERLAPPQRAGVVVALGGVALIAAGA